MPAASMRERPTFRTVWLSDMHLGSKDCRAEYLLDFLQRAECETLYLLGDIVDFWALRRRFVWPATHDEVLRLIMRKARNGTRVVYVPGNHDEVMREFIGQNIGAVELLHETSHVTADGRRLLLLHGDCLDVHIKLDRLSRFVGDAAYDALMWLHRCVNRARLATGLPYWSFAGYVKCRIKAACKAIALFRSAAMAAAHQRGFDGVVCGHIHHPEIETFDGIVYCNTGDWVENCTALVEGPDGQLDILHGADLCWAASPLQVSMPVSPA